MTPEETQALIEGAVENVSDRVTTLESEIRDLRSEIEEVRIALDRLDED